MRTGALGCSAEVVRHSGAVSIVEHLLTRGASARDIAQVCPASAPIARSGELHSMPTAMMSAGSMTTAS